MAVGVCRYDSMDRQLNNRLIDRVAAVYFVRDGGPADAAPADRSTPATPAVGPRPASAAGDHRAPVAQTRPITNPGR